jgi:hypothetical protein
MKPTLWSCSAHDHVILVLAHHPVYWHDVRSFAASVLHADAPVCEIVQGTSQEPPQYELQWTGSDVGASPDRHMQMRTFGSSEWRDA